METRQTSLQLSYVHLYVRIFPLFYVHISLQQQHLANHSIYANLSDDLIIGNILNLRRSAPMHPIKTNSRRNGVSGNHGRNRSLLFYLGLFGRCGNIDHRDYIFITIARRNYEFYLEEDRGI